ncbi:hypothetical protein [Sphingomonas oryzagri]
MFEFSEAAQACVFNGTICAKMAITPFVEDDGPDDRIWSDPYVLGVIQGMIVGQCLSQMGRELDEPTTGMVVMAAMENVGADIVAIRLSAQLAERANDSFMRGYDEALTASLLMTNSLPPERHSEEDIKSALVAAPQIRSGLELPPELEMDDYLAHGVAFLFIKVGTHRKTHYMN